MGENSYDYDVAISFLAKDEPLANQIRDALAPLRVFVYSKAQGEIAGTEGVETFREVFKGKSRVAMVLYRHGWGESPWTRVEETAIREKVWERGIEELMFVRLDREGEIPKWISSTYLYFDRESFGLTDLVGAVKAKLTHLGVQLSSWAGPRRETPLQDPLDSPPTPLYVSERLLIVEHPDRRPCRETGNRHELRSQSGPRNEHASAS